MMRLRVRYTKDGKVRFVSARDLTSIFERALRRADLPIAYSEGFHPHPKVSFPDALPVGVASTGEYAELTFAAPIHPGPAISALSDTLPDGMRILTYQTVDDGAPKLARLLEATLWEVVYPTTVPQQTAETVAALGRLCLRLLAADEATVTHLRPDGEQRLVDIRPALVAIHAAPRRLTRPLAGGPGTGEPPSHPTVRAVFRNDGTAIRPTDLHQALLAHRDPADTPFIDPLLVRRVVQGRLAEGGLCEALSGDHIPLEPEEAAA